MQALSDSAVICVRREFLALVLDLFMDNVADCSGGKEDSKKKLWAELEEHGAPSEETVTSLIGYAIHHRKFGLAELFAKVWRTSHKLTNDEGRRITEWRSYYQSRDWTARIRERVAAIKQR